MVCCFGLKLILALKVAISDPKIIILLIYQVYHQTQDTIRFIGATTILKVCHILFQRTKIRTSIIVVYSDTPL